MDAQIRRFKCRETGELCTHGGCKADGLCVVETEMRAKSAEAEKAAHEMRLRMATCIEDLGL